VPKLKENGAIDKSQFIFHLTDGTDRTKTSYLEFGTSADDTKYLFTSLSTGA
jgi:hypothetical protein